MFPDLQLFTSKSLVPVLRLFSGPLKNQDHVDVTNTGHFCVPVFKKYPFHELECPGGLQEVQFLNLLRSTLPPLAFDKPFEFFITDRTKRLIPLRVESFTPEQVSKAAGNSALYIRLKVGLWRSVCFEASHHVSLRSSQNPRWFCPTSAGPDLFLVFQRPVDFQVGQDGSENAPNVHAGPNTR